MMGEDETIEFLIRKKMIELQKRMWNARREEMLKGVIEVDSTEFKRILSKYRIVIADFWAEWCIPCRIVSSIIEKLSRIYSDKAVFVKVNVDENQDLAVENGILSIPTVIVFVNGREYERFIGAFPGLEKKISFLIERLAS